MTYPTTRTLWLDPTDQISVGLRRYTGSEGAGWTYADGYHSALVFTGTDDAVWRDTDDGRFLPRARDSARASSSTAQPPPRPRRTPARICAACAPAPRSRLSGHLAPLPPLEPTPGQAFMLPRYRPESAALLFDRHRQHAATMEPRSPGPA